MVRKKTGKPDDRGTSNAASVITDVCGMKLDALDSILYSSLTLHILGMSEISRGVGLPLLT